MNELKDFKVGLWILSFDQSMPYDPKYRYDLKKVIKIDHKSIIFQEYVIGELSGGQYGFYTRPYRFDSKRLGGQNTLTSGKIISESEAVKLLILDIFHKPIKSYKVGMILSDFEE